MKFISIRQIILNFRRKYYSHDDLAILVREQQRYYDIPVSSFKTISREIERMTQHRSLEHKDFKLKSRKGIFRKYRRV